MKLGREYELVFYAGADLAQVVKEILGVEEVQQFNTPDGYIYIGLNKKNAIGVVAIERDCEDSNTYLAKTLYANGEVQNFVIFLGEKVRVPKEFLSREVIV